MRIECAHTKLVKLSELRPHPDNRNKHSDAQIKVLAKIISQNGQRSPIVVSNQSGYITKGHARYEALKLLGWESGAVDYQNYKDEAEELRDRIADNEIARYAEFDKSGFISDIEKSELVLEELDYEDFELLDFNLKIIDQDKLINEINRGDENAAWVGSPEFEPKDKDVKLIIIFETELQRQNYCNDNNIPVTNKFNGQWTCRL